MSQLEMYFGKVRELGYHITPQMLDRHEEKKSKRVVGGCIVHKRRGRFNWKTVAADGPNILMTPFFVKEAQV